jgi:ABC-type sulfate/molybdate transport systems ATPase subunit
MIIVTHDPAQARRLSDRIVALEDGRICTQAVPRR